MEEERLVLQQKAGERQQKAEKKKGRVRKEAVGLARQNGEGDSLTLSSGILQVNYQPNWQLLHTVAYALGGCLAARRAQTLFWPCFDSLQVATSSGSQQYA